jgi:hypothetical protein
MNKLIVPAVIVAIGAASSDSWSQAASPQATESARREPFVITADDGGTMRKYARRRGVIIIGDNVGSVQKYLEKYEAWVAAGATFRIDGPCRSACTVVLAWPDRVCVTERAKLGFHQLLLQKEENNRLMSLYPAPVREYILARGGLPPGTMWVGGPALRELVMPCK